jgi:molecular chaperone DnaK
MQRDPIVGIDLGTTFSAVAAVQDGRPRILSSASERLLPSVVAFSKRAKWLVGTAARNQYILDPENTVRSIKRKMGSGERIRLAEFEFSPQQISAFILREMKRIAEVELGQPVERAVITVPAYFSDAQRQATKDAGEIAGLDVVRIINEPTAAALAYGLSQADDQMALVYDLGGGTFDVSLVELTSGVVEVRASHGDTQLGGDDFDERLTQYVLDDLQQRHHVDVSGNRRALARLNQAAEQAKIHLSQHPFAWIREEYLLEKEGQPLHVDLEISRIQFEALIEDLLQKTLESVDWVLRDGGLSPSDLDRILLVGGATRMPAVWRLLAEHLGIEPEMAVNPDEAVALGAAVQAASISGQPVGPILVDVTPFSLGIEVATFVGNTPVPDMYQPLVRRNTTIPVTQEEVFSTTYPGQDSVEVKVFQGEQPLASQNTLLGKFLIEGLEPESPGERARVTVSFDIDVNGILRVQAADRKTDQQKTITISVSRERLSTRELKRASAQLAALGLAGSDMIDMDELQVLLDRARRLLDGGSLDPEQAEQMELTIEDVETAHRLSEVERLDSLLEDLLDLLFEVEV